MNRPFANHRSVSRRISRGLPDAAFGYAGRLLSLRSLSSILQASDDRGR
jgi:hypothetical protein